MSIARTTSMRAVVVTCLLLLAFMAGCSNRDVLPTSTGSPYEVLVVATDSQTAAIVMPTLQVPMAGLPQEEPLFDASFCDADHYGHAQRLMRSIVMIDIDGNRHPKVEIRYEHDKDAAPQMIVHLNAPSRAALVDMMKGKTGGAKLTSLLLSHEEAIQTRFIDEHRNTQMEHLADSMFGIDIHIPANMQASKKDDGFLWCADNGGTTMQSLCIFKGTRVDSVLKKHIQGEKDGMYMTIEKGKNRGLWEMKGDAMGGPYVMKTIVQKHQAGSMAGDTITLLGFVYAPGHDKRIMIRRLEAMMKAAKVDSQ